MNTFHITNRLLKSTLFCGLLLFSSSALSCSSDDDGGGNGGTQLEWLEPIRVASYNIQYDNRNEEAGRWENRKEIVCRLLEAEDFDIFGAPGTLQVPDRGYGRRPSRIHLDRHERDGRRQCGAPSFQSDILQDRQIRSARKRFVLVFGDAQRSQYEILRLLFPAHVQLGAFPREGTGKEFFHFNSHFDHIGTVARAESAKLLIEKVAEIAGKTPAFCTGDFNSNQQTNVYNTIVTSGTLVDSYARTTDKVNADWPSYNGYKYISTPPAKASRIDHIFVTKGRTKVQSWAIVNTSYSQKYPSDHFPVVIEWSFAK